MAPRSRPALLAAFLLAAVAAALGAALPAAALELTLDRPRERTGYVWSDVRLRDLFPERVESSLARGMPATLQLHAELWRRREGWFDRLESSYDASLRIRYEVWNETYRLERPDVPPVAFASLDSVRRVLSRPLALPVGRVGELHPRHTYYVVVTATLKPLSVEDVEEMEGWLSGEVAGPRRERLGFLTQIPRSVFDAVRNFAGFGDQKARAISPDFDLRSLFPQR